MDPGDPVVDAIYSPGEEVPANGWKDYYVTLLNNLQPGVTEIFVHLAYDDAESQAMDGGPSRTGSCLATTRVRCHFQSRISSCSGRESPGAYSMARHPKAHVRVAQSSSTLIRSALPDSDEPGMQERVVRRLHHPCQRGKTMPEHNSSSLHQEARPDRRKGANS